MAAVNDADGNVWSITPDGRGLVSIDATIPAPVPDIFTRVLKFEPVVGEEIRREETVTDDYHGVATDSDPTSSPTWKVVRFYKDASGNVVRVRYRTGVVWDNRTAGW